MSGSTSNDVYLDNNATTRVLPFAAEEAQQAMEELFGNPSSSHITGLRARHILESTRALVSTALGAEQGHMIFTSGATEGIQTAVFSALCEYRSQAATNPIPQSVLLYGATEHKAVPQALEHWNQVLDIGAEVIAIPVDASGQLDLDTLRQLAPRAILIATMAVNNETGVIHDLAEIQNVIRDSNSRARWMVDSVQAVGKLNYRLSDLAIDYAPLSGHKIHAPKGIGMLYIHNDAPLTPLLAGGGQEHGARAGTENLPGAAALGAVFRCLTDSQDTSFKSLETLSRYRDQLTDALRTAFPDLVFNNPFETSVPTTLNFSVKGFSSKELLDLFDAAGIRVSSGSACGSSAARSFVLDAMGLPPWRSFGAIRMSVGLTATGREIDEACDRIRSVGRALRGSCLVLSNSLDPERSAPIDGLLQIKTDHHCTWLLIHQQTVIVIDPVDSIVGRIETLVRCRGLSVLAVLTTTNDPEITGPRNALLEQLAEFLAPSANDTDPFGWPNLSRLNVRLANGQSAPAIQIGPREVLVRLGSHDETHHAFYGLGRPNSEGVLSAADLDCVFSGTALPIGGFAIEQNQHDGQPTAELNAALQCLAPNLTGSTLICPAIDTDNGFCTHLLAESKNSEWLRQWLEDKGETRGTTTSSESKIEATTAGDSQQPLIDIAQDGLEQFFAAHKDAWVLDVREPHEHRLTQDWQALGLNQPPLNVPLTRFTQFVRRLIRDRQFQSNQDIIFLCRSGNRSGRAAKRLRQLGHTHAWHVAGGIALRIPHDAPQADELEYVI